MENKIMIAEEIIKKYYNEGSGPGEDSYSEENIIKAMIEFAKYHVKAALEAALEKSFCDTEEDKYGEETITGINTDSILNAYDLNQIK